MEQGERKITRFRTQKTAALLGYLAYTLRPQSRETLLELFWPTHDLDAARNSLNVALTSLRRQLEPSGIPAGSILLTGRIHVQLNSDTCATDVAEFEAALQAAGQADGEAAQVQRLAQAVELYGGELLAGYYEEWILAERPRLASAYLGTLRRLVKSLAQAREYDRALDYAHRAIRADPLREVSYRDLMRLYIAVGRPAAALEQYHELERVLKANIGAVPSPATRELVQQVSAESQAVVYDAGTIAASAPSPPASAPNYPDNVQVTPTAVGNALPLPLTRFFGREEEIAQLLSLLQVQTSSPRLVTLTGPGGCGKTRLAIEAAGRLTEAYGGAIWFVPLADVTEPHRIGDSLHNALNLPRSSEAEPIAQIVSLLSRRTSLLVMDNFEHLLEGRSLVRDLLGRAPALKVLATSRQSLGIAGEQEFLVLPLPIPADGEVKGERKKEKETFSPFLLSFPSVQLFVDRAQSKRPGFQITNANASAIAALCDRLEGIPLALELAAGWAHTLTPEQMLERLSHRFELLVSRHKDLEPRHRSLQAALEGSYRLLEPDVQHLFAQLSVFRGGWTLEAAEAVCFADEGIEYRVSGGGKQHFPTSDTQHPDILDYLAQLQERSLVTANETWDSAQMRFQMLETIREYSRDRLWERGEAKQVGERHRDFFLAFAEQARPHLSSSDQAEWLSRLEAEHENLRAALAWCLEDADSTVEGLRLVGALRTFWEMRGYLTEGRKHYADALARPGAQGRTKERADAIQGAAVLAHVQGDYIQAHALYEESLTIFRELGEKRGIAGALNNLGLLVQNQGDYVQAQALYEESLVLQRELENKVAAATTLGNLGVIAFEQGELARARVLFEEYLTLIRELDNRSGIATALHNLASVATMQGDYAAARPLYEQALSASREVGHKAWEAYTLRCLGSVAQLQGDFKQARALYVESLSMFQELEERSGAIESLEACAGLAAEEGQAVYAARLWGATEALREAAGFPIAPIERANYDRDVAVVRAALDTKAFETAWADGRALTLEQAIKYALKETLE